MKSERVDLIVAAAHELKAPLVLIRHLSQTLQSSQLSVTEQIELLQRITVTAERSLKLTNQITDASRLKSIQQLDLGGALEPVNVQYACEQVLSELSPYAQKFNQKIQLKMLRRNNLAIANKDLLHDVLVNLVDNSLKHNPVGGSIELSASMLDKKIRIKIKDDSPGIEKDELRQLSGNMGVKSRPIAGLTGTNGIGLYVAGRLTSAMGGRLTLGRARQGAVFLIDLLSLSQLKFL